MNSSLSRRLSAIEATHNPSPTYRVLTCEDDVLRNPVARAAWEARQPPEPRGCMTIIIRKIASQEGTINAS